MVAVRPKDLQLVYEALGDEFDIVVCHTFDEAQELLNGHISLIACGVRFDDGRMLDLLRYAKARHQTRAIPFHLMLASDRGYSDAVLNGIKTATTVLGAAGFTDIGSMVGEFGKARAYELIRAGIRALIGG
jgi:hypothetical protein